MTAQHRSAPAEQGIEIPASHSEVPLRGLGRDAAVISEIGHHRAGQVVISKGVRKGGLDHTERGLQTPVNCGSAPPEVLGLAKLAKRSFDREDLRPLWQELARLASDERSGAAALTDLSILDQIINGGLHAAALQAEALRACRLYRVASRCERPSLRLLGLAIAGDIGANVPVEFLVEDSDVELCLLYVTASEPLPPVPNHDVAMVLVGESERARPVLHKLGHTLARWPRPVLNLPRRISRVGRETLPGLLADVPGLVTTPTSRVPRDILAAWSAEQSSPASGFPVIARPFDRHAGFGLSKLDSPADVSIYLAGRPETGFHIAPFIDYCGADGQHRKYRIAFIDGVPYPSHLAISESWMVHYVSAGMTECAAKRAEEERWMRGFRTDFCQRHGEALSAAAAALELDYFGIDCGETRDGRLLLFEADTGMVVHNMDPPSVFPYKGPHMQALFTAFRAMLHRRALR